MKKTIFCILCFLLCALMLLSAVACKPQDANNPSDDTPGSDTPGTDDPGTNNPGDDQEVDGLLLVANGTAFYRVVRGDMESTAIRDASLAVINAIEAQTGVRPQPATDWEPYDENVKEIIVGSKNNRPAVEGLADSLEPDSFRITTVDGNIVIIGSDATATDIAVEYFIKTYVSQATDTLLLPKSINKSMTIMEWQTENHQSTVTLKKSYSDYVTTFEEINLVDFDDGDSNYVSAYGGYYDDDHSIDDGGSLRWDLKGAYENVTKILNQTNKMLAFDASDKNKSTLKFWLYVSDTDKVVCDHDPGYGFQKNQATFYFRVTDKNGRTHAWNHTITNNGWHEIELSFNIHNGADENFDYANITGFWVGLATYDDVTIMIDDLRGVVYETDYSPEAIEGETNPRLISDCEFDALDGAIIQEWYGASYDKDDKVQGQSSLRNSGDASVNDFRTIIANLDLAMDQQKDELVFHFKVADIRALKSIFIELNQVQDKHEYSASFTLEQLKAYGFGGENNTWYEIRIPLSVFAKQLGEGMGDTIQLHNFRFVGSATGTAFYDYHIDHIYLAEK